MQNNKYSDLNRSLMGSMKTIRAETPDLVKGFQSLHHAAFKAGVLDTQTKELMALACAIVTGCESCIASHTSAAVRAGASREAFFETLGVAILMGGGAALAYAAKAEEAFQEFSEA